MRKTHFQFTCLVISLIGVYLVAFISIPKPPLKRFDQKTIDAENSDKLINKIGNNPLDHTLFKPLSEEDQKFEQFCLNLMSGETSEEDFEVAINIDRHQFEYTLQNGSLPSCDAYHKDRTVLLPPVNKLEADFPLAFGIIVYKNFAQVEQLFRTIYRPNNFYCFHVDKSAPELFKEQMRELVDCFPDNVFLASNPVNVIYPSHTILLSELSCMKDMVEKSRDWKYYINLTGEEFLLVTNLELVNVLKAHHGTNIVCGSRREVIKSRLPKTLPLNLRKYKGSTHVFLNYKAVEFILTSNISNALLDALSHFRSSCESFFHILQLNPEVNFPGGMERHPEDALYSRADYVRFKQWVYRDARMCASGFVKRAICMLGVKHLHQLTTEAYGKKLAANKFPYDFQPAAWDCMQVWNRNKVKKEYITGKVAIDLLNFMNNSYVQNGRHVEGF